MGEKLVFSEIDGQIDFKNLLEFYDIDYEEDKQGNLTFVTTNAKNSQIKAKAIRFPTGEGQKPYFFTLEALKGNKKSGTPINFVEWHDDIPIRDAASKLKKIFIAGPKKKAMPEYDLQDHPIIEPYLHLRRSFEFGFCNVGVMKNYIAFRCYNPDNTVEGYVGWHTETHKWYFPDGFKRPVYNIERANGDSCIMVTDLFEFLHLHTLGHTNVICTLGHSLTQTQLPQLEKFKKILLFHPKPQYIIDKIAPFAFIKAPKLEKTIFEYDSIDEFI